jgi:hypothetical protein
MVKGTVMKTPTLLMLALRPWKNRPACGNHTLTGQDRFVRCSLRCSTDVSMHDSPNLPTVPTQRIGRVKMVTLEIFAKITQSNAESDFLLLNRYKRLHLSDGFAA